MSLWSNWCVKSIILEWTWRCPHILIEIYSSSYNLQPAVTRTAWYNIGVLSNMMWYSQWSFWLLEVKSLKCDATKYSFTMYSPCQSLGKMDWLWDFATSMVNIVCHLINFTARNPNETYFAKSCHQLKIALYSIWCVYVINLWYVYKPYKPCRIYWCHRLWLR